MVERNMRWALLVVSVALLLASPIAIEGGERGGTDPASTDRPIGLPDAIPPAGPDVERMLSVAAPHFVENRGQVPHPEVRYYAEGDPLSVGLTPWGALFILGDSGTRSTAFSMRFSGCREAEPHGAGRLGHTESFYVGNDPSRWVQGAPAFEEVVLEGLYDGVDLRFYFRDGLLKYDLVLAPGVDPSVVRVAYDGVEAMSVDPATGELVLHTRLGTIRDARPLAIQELASGRSVIEASFELEGPRALGFSVDGAWDRNLALVIDPGLEFFTYLGGIRDEYAGAVMIDADGNVHLAGTTTTADFLLPPGAVANQSFYPDAFWVMFNSTGTLLSSMRFGGAGSDAPRSMVTLDDGSVCVVGFTTSEDFSMVNATDTAISDTEGFLLRFPIEGTPTYSSYFGGSLYDIIEDVAVGADGSVYIFGTTESTDLYTTPGAFDRTSSGSACFAARFNLSTRTFVYSTYLDGTDQDLCMGGCLGPLGEAYIVGHTQSSMAEGFPVVSGDYDTTLSVGSDGFVLKLDALGRNVLHGTYLGGNGMDSVKAIERRQNGAVVVAGTTNSTDFPTSSAYQASLAGLNDGFIAVLDADLSTLDFSTYFGGSSYETANALAFDSAADVAYIYGFTQSGQLDVTPGAFDTTWSGDNDIFVGGIDVVSGELTYCSYIGGTGSETVNPNTIVCDPEGMLYIAGTTGSDEFPRTPGAYCSTFNGGFGDAFLMKLDPRPIDKAPSKPPAPTAVPGNRSVTVRWEAPDWFGSMGVVYHVYREVEGGNPRRFDVGGNLSFHDNDTVVNGVNHTYRVSASNTFGEGPPSDAVTVMPLGPPSAPRNPNATSDFGRVDLKWDPPEDTGGLVHGYWVYRRMAGSGSIVSTRVVNSTTFKDSDVDVGKEYIYWVIAYNIFDGPSSVEAMVTVVDRPSPPTVFEATEGDNRIDLAWGDPETLGGGGPLIGFQLARHSSDSGLDWNRSLPPNQHTYPDTEVQNGGQYRYVLVAKTDLGAGNSVEVEASPYGAPLAPTGLKATRGNGSVTLTWTDGHDNGRPVTGYMINIVDTRTQVTSSKQIYVHEERIVGGLTNGVEYNFTVAAINERGVGEESKNASCTPMGPPSAPRNLMHENTPDYIRLTWDPPTDTGGAELGSLLYTVERRMLPSGWTTLGDVSGATYYEDLDIMLRTSYTYRVTASHGGLTGEPSVSHTVIYRRVPLPVVGLNATVVGETVELDWTPSDVDVGSETTQYIVYRNESGGPMREYVTIPALTFTGTHVDRNVTLGTVYYYKVVAVNEEGEGLATDAIEADLRVRARPPGDLNYQDVEGRVQLSWAEPSPVGSLPVTGYAIYRGRSRDSLVRITEVGPVLTYLDDFDRDQGAYYAVASIDERGESQRSQILEVPPIEDGILPSGLSMMVLLVIILVVIAVVLIYARAIRRAREAPPVAATEAAPAAPPAARAAPTVPSPAPVPSAPQYIIEKVFVIFRDGRLIAECGRDECKTKDADLMSGMLIAVQGIVQDGLHSGGVLESIKYGDNLIMMAAGRHVNLAAVILGDPEEGLKDELEATVQRIEATYSGIIEQWIGDLSVLKDVDKLVRPLLDKTAGVSAEAIAGTAAAPGITVLSANDLHMGYVRLKVAVVNTTEESATEASIEVHYDHEMLRLERVRPEKLMLRGDRVSLGTIRPGERKSVAFLFDPQICQATYIDGTLIYYDHKGELHRAEMKRRHAEVVCPILFTRKTASTAMLRRLIAEKLHASDLRVLRYPEQVRPQEVLEVGKIVMGRFSVQMVREYVTEGPPYEAEVWYYGETKVKGYELVMRLGVVAGKRAMEFFVASTDMEPITGLLAEFRRDATEVMREQHPGLPELVTERDDELKATLGGRDLLLDGEGGR